MLHKLVNPFEPQFSYLWNGDTKIYLTKEVVRIVLINHLAQYMACKQHAHIMTNYWWLKHRVLVSENWWKSPWSLGNLITLFISSFISDSVLCLFLCLPLCAYVHGYGNIIYKYKYTFIHTHLSWFEPLSLVCVCLWGQGLLLIYLKSLALNAGAAQSKDSVMCVI